jgi:hypothetical protein
LLELKLIVSHGAHLLKFGQITKVVFKDGWAITNMESSLQ